MLVTAVITTHKRGPEIVERALKSVIEQTYKNIEILVVDDSPAEYSLRTDVKNMVVSYANCNVTYVAHPKCMGACAARNTGLELAHGDFIGYLDDDDEWLPTKVEEQVNAFHSNDVALVYCDSLTYYESTGDTREHKCQRVEGDVYTKLLLTNNFIGSTSFPLLRTAALKEIGGFDVEMQSAQDYDVWTRIAKKYAVNYVAKPLARYHFHEGEQITKNPAKKIAGMERINQKNADFLATHADAYWVNYMNLVPWYVRTGNRKKAFSVWLKTIFKAPFKLKDNAKFLYVILSR